MLELYSLNITVPAGADIPLNSAAFAKGCTATYAAPAAVALNKKGVYRVAVNASVEPAAAGEVTIQLVRDGVSIPYATSSLTGETGAIATLGFETLVKVQEDNTCSCTSSPVILQLLNSSEVEVTFPIVSMVVSKLC